MAKGVHTIAGEVCCAQAQIDVAENQPHVLRPDRRARAYTARRIIRQAPVTAAKSAPARCAPCAGVRQRQTEVQVIGDAMRPRARHRPGVMRRWLEIARAPNSTTSGPTMRDRALQPARLHGQRIDLQQQRIRRWRRARRNCPWPAKLKAPGSESRTRGSRCGSAVRYSRVAVSRLSYRPR